MKVLVCGNLGYVGPVVMANLRDRFPTANLIGFDTGFFKACLTDPSYRPEAVIDRQIFGDVRNLTPDLFEGVDTVIYLAAISNDPMGNVFERQTLDINGDCALRAAELAKAAGASRFVFASSCSVYGSVGSAAKDESATVEPQTAYAKSKVEAEAKLTGLSGDGFVITCLRFATACGFSPRLRLDLVLNDFVATALTRKAIEVLSDGKPWRPLIHVKDMARAMEWALERRAEQGGAFLSLNTGADAANYQIRDLAASVAAELGNVSVSINENASPDRRSYRVDFRLFRKLAPEHQPQFALQDMVKDLVTNLTRIGFNDTDFRTGSLIRLNHIKDLIQAGAIDEALHWRHAVPAQA